MKLLLFWHRNKLYANPCNPLATAEWNSMLYVSFFMITGMFTSITIATGEVNDQLS
jgi:hypothetical protein